MRREIKLDGGEIMVLKTLGLTGTPMYGKMFLSRVGAMQGSELADTLEGLIDRGYIISSKVNLRKLEEIERSFFRVNSAYSRELRDAIRPGKRRDEKAEKRRRRA